MTNIHEKPKLEYPHSLCQFGIARRDITPPVGIYHRMWGAAKHDQSEGVHRPLIATAVVFAPHSVNDGLTQQTTEHTQVLIALDHCLLYQTEMKRLIEHVTNHGFHADQITFTFSHTHSAGLMDPRRREMPGGEMIEGYLEQLALQIGEAVAEALGKTRAAMIQYATGRCNLAANRDFWDEENQAYVCGFNPGAKADDTVIVAQVRNPDDCGQTLATFVNYACHPTTLAWDNRMISPDYVGAMREVVEQATDAPCVFLQGASGDLGPVHGFVGDLEVADRNGRQLGYAALSALESMAVRNGNLRYDGPVVSGATIGFWRRVPLDKVEEEQKATWRKRQWTVDLSYREGLATVEETKTELQRWTTEEQAARDAGDANKAADARAMAERMRRMLTRVADLPTGDSFSFPVMMWRIGDAVWIAVEGEPYNYLQTTLRDRFPEIPIVLIVLANGSRPSYLPTRETYGKGIYQESIALLEQGSLEILAQAIGDEIDKW